MRTHPGKVMTMLAAVTLGVWIAAAQQAKKVDDAALKNAAKSTAEWLTYGHDYAETHYSPLDQINAENVSRLGLAWTWKTDSPTGANVETTPLVANGVMYGSLGWNVLFAIDARTGAFKWKWDPEIPRGLMEGLCCGPVNRGVAIYNGRVYAGLLDGTLVALDQETGKVAWRSTVTTAPGTILTSAVRVVKGKVIVGSSGAEQAVRGFFAAYDAETGKEAWRFWTVPGDPAKPFEHSELAAAAKTWTGEWWKMGGGGTVWDGMAYDPEADLLYVGTGNGGPWPRAIRSPGGGDNLFLGSVLAVDPDNGKMKWYFQESPGDSWDFTSTQPMILADLQIGGKTRKVLMHAPKNGYFYVLDRITGEFISGKPFVQRLTWATGLDPKGRPILAEGAMYEVGDPPITLWPGAAGGHNWAPMSYSPKTGLVYIPGNEASTTYSVAQNFVFSEGKRNTGMAGALDGGGGRGKGGDAKGAPKQLAPATPREPATAKDQPQVNGRFMVAWDPVAQKERWRLTGDSVPSGPTLVTGGNLLFSSGQALNATTGEKLWEIDLPTRIATPITYMLDGKQYVSVLAGQDMGNYVFTFMLDGTARMPEVATEAPAGGKGK